MHTTGKVVSNLDVDIKCKASGTVKTLPYDISDAVKKGDVIVEIDPVDMNRIVTQSEGVAAGVQGAAGHRQGRTWRWPSGTSRPTRTGPRRP